ncbi:MAG: S8 family serine peptidase, partial [Tumebacillaceae bacterium]
MKKTMKVSSLALASALLVGGLPLQSVAATTTVSHAVLNMKTTATTQTGVKQGFISKKLNTTSSNMVRVIVTLSNQPIAVGKYAAKQGMKAFVAESTATAISAQQTSLVSTAKSQGINLSVNRKYDTVLNGMEITIPANQIPKLASLPGVVSVYENSTYYAMPDATPTDLQGMPDTSKNDMFPLEQIGVDKAWAQGLTGKGLKVGVIDTGVDYYHPDLQDAFKGGYNSINLNNDPYEDLPRGEDEGSFHGTHVSGTIVGRAANQAGTVNQRGVAYEADLHVYRVLGYDPKVGKSQGSSAQVIDGIERAVKDGMDVINLSLGSDSEKDPNSPDAIAINNAVLAGVTAVVANGNAAINVKGQYYYTMGSPASSQLGISVGAVTSPTAVPGGLATSSFDPTLKYQMLLAAYHTGEADMASVLGTDPIDGVYVGLGADDDYKNKDVTGKIAFISRGTLAFTDKFANAKAHGAKAIVLFNGNAQADDPTAVDLSDSITSRDSFIGSNFGSDDDYIPTFDMKGTEGRALAKQVLANPNTPLKFTFDSDYPLIPLPGDQMANFSSRGPNSDGNYSIKPDFSAPGVNILSTWPEYSKTADYTDAYGRISGTSMATPHVAGLALLLKQEHPNWTPFDIRAALANTSDEIKDEKGTQYDVYSQGAGRVNVGNAINTPAVLETVDNLTILDQNLNPQSVINYDDNASFGKMHAGDAAKTETLQVKNFSGDTVKYTASIKMHDKVTSDLYKPIPTPSSSDIDVSLAGLAD